MEKLNKKEKRDKRDRVYFGGQNRPGPFCPLGIKKVALLKAIFY